METTNKKTKKVIIYKFNILAYSETFIYEQTYNLRQWNGKLIGNNILTNGLNLEGISFHTIGFKNKLLEKCMRRFNFLLNRPPHGLIKELQQENADLIHIHFATEAVLAWPMLKELKLPIIVTLHGYDINVYREWWEKGNEGRTMKNYPRNLLQIAQEDNIQFLAVSEAIKTRAIEYGIPESKLEVSYIGVDTQKFTPSAKSISERTQILFVGRLVEKKGCRYLLEAFESIQHDYPLSELVIVGDGPLENSLKNFAKDKNLRATFLGALSGEKVKALMDEARVFCLPSITAESGDAEGLGIVILEAQACGVPVITSARGGATEGIQHRVTGFAHEEKDVAGIKYALHALFSDDELANEFGIAARKFAVKHMDIKKCTERLEEIYSKYA
ncbi:glycosyltransferase [Pseudomonas bubulae]|uniref:glycosyltransferase n=1 Tax=Pseudomonas bubulae TaxID=2316085 RepID=UPI003CFFDC46